MLALIALFASLPSNAYAQDSIAELETNTNASGKKRVSTTGRVFAEIGMGAVGEITAATASLLIAIPLLGILGNSGSDGLGILLVGGVISLGVFELAVTPITAELVYQGGRLTGGRSKRWAAYAGGYVGMASALLLGTIGLFTNDKKTSYLIIAGVAIPVLSLVGSIVGYELSDKSETNRLKSERDKLTQATSQQQSAPIMITLYTGSF